MNIVVINGQNHKGSTWHIGNLLTSSFSGENEIVEFFLPRDLNHFCLGCFRCMKDLSACPFYEEKNVIAEAMHQADVIILTSPNYCMLPSAPMKAFIDLFYQYWIPHRPQGSMFHKKAVVISTTAGVGARKVCAHLKRTLAYWGVPFIKSYATAVQASSWKEVDDKKKKIIEADMKRLAKTVESANLGKPSLFIRLMFNLMGQAKSKAKDSEATYWKECGWLDGKKPWLVK